MFSNCLIVTLIISVVECSIKYKIDKVEDESKYLNETQIFTDPHPYNRFVNGTFPAFLTPAASLALCPWAGNVSAFLDMEELLME